MEVTKIGSKGIRIKGKNALLLVDPESKGEGDIVLNLSQANNSSGAGGARLVISGPGEYEAGGISLNVKKMDTSFYAIVTEQEKILLLPSEILSKISDDDEYDSVILEVNSKISDDSFAPLNAKSVILYGNLDEAIVKGENQEKVSKVSLKKDAANGRVFLLA